MYVCVCGYMWIYVFKCTYMCMWVWVCGHGCVSTGMGVWECMQQERQRDKIRRYSVRKDYMKGKEKGGRLSIDVQNI